MSTVELLHSLTDLVNAKILNSVPGVRGFFYLVN